MPMIARVNVGWWIYAATILALGYGQMIRKIAADSGGFTSRYGPPLAATILAVGVIAAILQKPLLRRLFWKIIFGVFVFASSVLFGFGIYLLVAQDVPSWVILLVLGSAIYAVPAEIQLYRYAFRSGMVWNET